MTREAPRTPVEPPEHRTARDTPPGVKLTGNGRQILAFLADQGPASSATVAHHLYGDRRRIGWAENTLTALEAHGLIRRERPARGGRGRPVLYVWALTQQEHP